LRSSIRTSAGGIDVPVGEDGGRHIESNVNGFLFFCDCLMCDV
jgi:hypothetical protein